MKSIKEEYKKAQIMVITLLILMVVALIIVSLSVLLERDTDQVVSGQVFEQLYTDSNNKLRDFVARYGLETNLSELANEGCVLEYSDASGTKYSCSIVDSIGDGLSSTTIVEIADTKDVFDLELSKDKSFTVSLEGYEGQINSVWDQNIAVDFNLTYFDDANTNGVLDSNESLQTIQDIFDPFDIYTSSPNPYLSTESTFNFSPNGSNDQGMSFNIAGVDGWGANFVSQELVFIPRYNTGRDPIFDITPNSYTGYPEQVRDFDVSSFNTDSDDSPVTSIGTVLFIHPQSQSVFDYALFTEDSI